MAGPLVWGADAAEGVQAGNDYYLRGARDWIGRVVGSFLMGISGTDPITYVSVTAMLMLIGVTACYVPARRAASLDPTEALRHE